MDIVTQVIVILAEHDRKPNGGPCRCGWNELGQCHFRHKAEIMQEAGLLKEDPK